MNQNKKRIWKNNKRVIWEKIHQDKKRIWKNNKKVIWEKINFNLTIKSAFLQIPSKKK